MDRVQYSQGVPRWFTYLLHLWSKRRCRKVGHTITAWPDVCDHCGEILS
jgi:hypothetical protein